LTGITNSMLASEKPFSEIFPRFIGWVQDCIQEAQQLHGVPYVTRFWENNPNRTSVKIKLTLPMDSYTTALLVQTFSITQTTEGWL